MESGWCAVDQASRRGGAANTVNRAWPTTLGPVPESAGAVRWPALWAGWGGVCRSPAQGPQASGAGLREVADPLRAAGVAQHRQYRG